MIGIAEIILDSKIKAQDPVYTTKNYNPHRFILLFLILNSGFFLLLQMVYSKMKKKSFKKLLTKP